MATISTHTSGGTVGHPSRREVRGAYVVDAVLDFITGDTNAIAAGSSDTIWALNIPAGTLVISAGLEIITAGTGSGTLQVTDGTTTFTSTKACNATGYATVTDTADKNITAAGFLGVVAATAVPDCKCRVYAVLADVINLNGTGVVGN